MDGPVDGVGNRETGVGLLEESYPSLPPVSPSTDLGDLDTTSADQVMMSDWLWAVRVVALVVMSESRGLEEVADGNGAQCVLFSFTRHPLFDTRGQSWWRHQRIGRKASAM